MSIPLKRLQFIDFSGAVQNKTGEKLQGANQVIHALNADFDKKLGKITGRQGSIVQSTVVAAKEVLNILKYKQGATKHYFAVSDDGAETPKVDVYKSDTDLDGTWTKSLQDWTTALGINGANFGKRLCVFNGADAPYQWNGTGWSAITNAPVTGKYPEVFNNILYVLAEDGFLHYSDVVAADGDGWTSTTWTNRGINPNDGQKATMLARHRGRLIIFKEDSLYRYNGNSDPEPLVNVGTHSGRSVVIQKDLFFHHRRTIYKMGLGDPVDVSKPMEKYLNGMTVANWQNVSAGRDANGNVYFWIGNVTINDPREWDYGVTYTNMVLVHNIYTQRWTPFTGWDARVWFFDEETGETFFCTSAGKIVKIRTGGYIDKDGTTELSIRFEVVFTPQDYSFPDKLKKINQISVIGADQINIAAGESPDKMDKVEQMKDGEARISEAITFKKLWVMAFEEYKTEPPVIEQLIYDGAEMYDDK